MTVPGKVRAIGIGLLLAGSLQISCEKKASPPAQVTLGKTTWNVELAMTADRRYRGLSGRTKMDASEGMLFIYPHEKLLSFCMRGCVIPLDIAFLDAEGKVVAMHTMKVEADMAGRIGYSSGRPAQYALEVPAGALTRAGVQLGDKAEFSEKIPPAAKATPDP